jgi:hypothetical protein
MSPKVVARISQGNIDRFYVPEVVARVMSGNINEFYVCSNQFAAFMQGILNEMLINSSIQLSFKEENA